MVIELKNLDKNYKKHLKVGQMSDNQRRKQGIYTEDEENSGKYENSNSNNSINKIAKNLNSDRGSAVRF